jgi:sugar diacid utilization regulator
VRLLVTEHAAMICGVILGRERVVAAASGRARRDLIEGLLLVRDRDGDEAENWARHLGISGTHEHHVIALAISMESDETRTAPVRSAALSLLESLLAAKAPGTIVTTRGYEVVAIVPVSGGTTSPAQLAGIGAQCKAAVEDRYSGLTVLIGIGGRSQRAIDIARSYSEARRAIETAARMRHLGDVIAFDDLGIQRLLMRVPDVAELRSFASEVLGDLLDSVSSEYLATLAVYFNENGSPQRAARQLHVHPNTVSYRVRRIEEITGLSLNAHRDRLVLQVAVEIVNAVGAR